MQALFSGGGFGHTFSIKQVFNCNNVIDLKASLQFIFILQLITSDNKIQQVRQQQPGSD